MPLPPGEEGEAPGVILSERFDEPEIGKVTNNLPIRGVFSPGKENAIHSFLGKTAISEWHFTVELASFQQQGTPDDPAFVRPFPAWQIGKPFPDGGDLRRLYFCRQIRPWVLVVDDLQQACSNLILPLLRQGQEPLDGLFCKLGHRRSPSRRHILAIKV